MLADVKVREDACLCLPSVIVVLSHLPRLPYRASSGNSLSLSREIKLMKIRIKGENPFNAPVSVCTRPRMN